MKGTFKKIINFAIVAVLCILSFGLFACEDLKHIEVKVSVYDIDNARLVEKTMKIDLYRHLAGDTVDAITEYINKGYYDGTVFYVNKNTTETGSAISFGDYSFDSSFSVVRNSASYVRSIRGQFEYNGTIGSDLVNAEGYLGLWRDWTAKNGYTTSDAAMDTGRASLYMPTSNISSMNGYFCVFGKINLNDSETSSAWKLISNVMSNSTYYTNYTVYYYGTYDVSKASSDFGLTFGIMKTEDFSANYNSDTKILHTDDGDIEVFEGEGEEYVEYQRHNVYLPIWDNSGKGNIITAKIVSVKVK